jgi:hypothetical protein
MRRGASSVEKPGSDEIRLVVVARVLLTGTVPPALLSVGCCCAGDDLLGFSRAAGFSSTRADRRLQSGDGPDEARQFACDRGDYDGRRLSRPGQRAVAAAQSLLRDRIGLHHLVWGSDWPHTQFEKVTDYATARAELETWLPDPPTARLFCLKLRASFSGLVLNTAVSQNFLCS